MYAVYDSVSRLWAFGQFGGAMTPTATQLTRRLQAHYLGIAKTTPAAPQVGGPLWRVQWLGAHGGASVTTLSLLTGIGHEAGHMWPADDGSGQVPVVLTCRTTATATAAAATLIEQSRTPDLAHIRLLGLVIVAASPKPVPQPVRTRLMLICGWVANHWWIGWQDAYLAADDPRTVGPSPDVTALRDHLASLLLRSRT
jgi:hypothetical protein